MAHLVAYGVYLPHWRLDRTKIRAVLGSGGGKGARSVAGPDEDTTSLAVEAARRTLASAPDGYRPDVLILVTTTPAYVDKTNATAIHAALQLPDSAAAYDMAGSVRSTMGAILLAQATNLDTLVVCADIRTGRPGSADEADGGDGAVGFAFSAEHEPLLAPIGRGSSSAEFLDRWRTPGAEASSVWEERFGETAYLTHGRESLTAALKDAGVTSDEVDHLIVAGVHGRAVRSFRSTSEIQPTRHVNDLTDRVGNTGAAHAPLLLASILDAAVSPGDVVAMLQLADGADAAVFRATDELARYRQRQPGSTITDVAAGSSDLGYTTFLTWRGWLEQEPPRRPDPAAPAAPVSYRREDWKFGFAGSRCDSCGTRHSPPARVCMNCRGTDNMSPERLADVRGTVATFTVDHLAYSPSPPVIAAVVDLDGGGRIACEMTDATPADITIGTRVEFTFRRLNTADRGVHNYFWKARPIRGDG